MTISAPAEQAVVPAGEEWSSELYVVAATQFKRAADALDLDPEFRTRLLTPRRSLTVNFPVRMDDDTVQSFTGYRVQHTLTMGPTKGGFRFAPDVSLGECAALAMWMTWKCALLGLPYGGAKGGVRCAPNQLSARETERITRRYASELIPVIGPERDIPAPDMATGEAEMAWFMDTYSQQVGHSVPEIVTGKPAVLGGTAVRREATGLGLVYVIEALLERRAERLEGKKVAVQGFGNVGATVATELHRRGAVVVGVSDYSGGLVASDGLDIPAIAQWVATQGFLLDCPHGDAVPRDDVLDLPCDIVVPAALEGQITARNASRLRCRFIVEGANGPMTPAGEELARERDIVVVPDVLANAGGVTVSYFEWVQDIQRYLWDDDAVRDRLRSLLRAAFTRVADAAEAHGRDLRTTALIEAVDRVARAAQARGIYP